MKVRIRIKSDISILFIASHGKLSIPQHPVKICIVIQNYIAFNSFRFIALLVLGKEVTHIHAAPATSAGY